jgi:hypothetical protein
VGFIVFRKLRGNPESALVGRILEICATNLRVRMIKGYNDVRVIITHHVNWDSYPGCGLLSW